MSDKERGICSCNRFIPPDIPTPMNVVVAAFDCYSNLREGILAQGKSEEQNSLRNSTAASRFALHKIRLNLPTDWTFAAGAKTFQERAASYKNRP